jgi:hypothetical protein
MADDESPSAGLRESHAYDPDLHEPGSPAAEGRCSYHQQDGQDASACTGPAVVSYESGDGWKSGCSAALEELVERGVIQPLGQGA